MVNPKTGATVSVDLRRHTVDELSRAVETGAEMSERHRTSQRTNPLIELGPEDDLSPEDYAYHVTYLVDLASIVASGLVPGNGGKFGGHQTRSQGKIFFTEWSGVRYWFDKLDSFAHGLTDHAEEGWVPVVLRTADEDHSSEDWQEDVDGTADSHHEAFYIEGTQRKPARVRAMDLDVWDGSAWVPLDEADPEGMLETALAAATIEEPDEPDPDDEDEPEEPIYYMDGDVFLPPGADY